MEEKHIMKVAITCAVIGIVLLFLLLKDSEAQVDRVTADEKPDQFEGTVMSMIEREGVTSLLLERTETIKVTLFGPVPRVETGDFVQIRGELSENEEGSSEIIGEEMRVIG